MNIGSFGSRHIGPGKEDMPKMLSTIGVDSIDQLIYETLPDGIRLEQELNLPEAMSEKVFQDHIAALSDKNKIYKSYIGLGYHGTHMPAVIQRNILENPGWYTAYTPYQAEIAQGRLEALLNFQTMVMELTGMEIANASLLDEGTAAGEAVSMFLAARSREKAKTGAVKFFVDENLYPQTIDVLITRATPIGVELVFGDFKNFNPGPEFFGAIVQYPNKCGEANDYRGFVESCKVHEIQVAVAADLLSLTLLTPPGEWGADAVLGTTQRFGIPMGYGGPHAAYFATHDEYKRHIPGRIIGVSVDTDGKPALRMALQTREQHIKRDKATSNICTAQVLLAVMAGMYGVYHGPKGLKKIAEDIHLAATSLEKGLDALGHKQNNHSYFDTIHISLNGLSASKLREQAEKAGINMWYVDESTVCISLNELVGDADVQELVNVFAAAQGKGAVKQESAAPRIADAVKRSSEYLKQGVFNSYRSESDMMRYIKKLERKDLSLNHSMIALGSCTMKLNAASEMIPLSWPKWANIHPFAPKDQVAGYQEVFSEMEKYLAEITGFAATSLQPNSGAQGEYAGLMVIRAYHHSRGDFHRNISLIPSSAHGTNPASAVMAGMEVVVVACDERGNIDVEDLKAKAEKYSENLSCLMITYPSTHGVFEASVKDITAIIHQHGGQVYMDGANMNAQVGLTSPGRIGADVCHLNLHKTFAIPHGGGGPGMGPICVAAHLAPFLPTNPVVATGGNKAINAVSAAPWGSGLILLISYAYIRMLGAKGLKDSTVFAIVNANYMKSRLEKEFPILYTGEKGRCAHEMIVDPRPFKKTTGVDVTDIAKRLMDYGFHAPTVSFPVAGTLMIEPTESEGLAELDRFCDTLLMIKKEMDEIEDGQFTQDNNVLVNSPHTMEMITADNWNMPYSRKKAAYPLHWIHENKFWPSIRRIDQAFGDRNLVCSCEPIESYMNEHVNA